MTHPNHETNGASLEDCHTNFYALVSEILFFCTFYSLLSKRGKYLSSFVRSTTNSGRLVQRNVKVIHDYGRGFRIRNTHYEVLHEREFGHLWFLHITDKWVYFVQQKSVIFRCTEFRNVCTSFCYLRGKKTECLRNANVSVFFFLTAAVLITDNP